MTKQTQNAPKNVPVTVLPGLTVEQTEKVGTFKNTSTKVRYLAAQNLSRGTIAKALGLRYQHVRNVLITPVTKVSEQF